MSLQVLSPNSAYAHGSELWALPKLDSSFWARDIDWILNFQISFRKDHPQLQISPPLEKIINDMDMEVKKVFLKKKNPLMIISPDRLPNKETLYIDSYKDFYDWVEQIHHLWNNLNRPTLRLFLPQGMSQKEFESLWPEEDLTSTNITLVLNTHEL